MHGAPACDTLHVELATRVGGIGKHQLLRSAWQRATKRGAEHLVVRYRAVNNQVAWQNRTGAPVSDPARRSGQPNPTRAVNAPYVNCDSFLSFLMLASLPARAVLATHNNANATTAPRSVAEAAAIVRAAAGLEFCPARVPATAAPLSSLNTPGLRCLPDLAAPACPLTAGGERERG